MHIVHYSINLAVVLILCLLFLGSCASSQQSLNSLAFDLEKRNRSVQIDPLGNIYILTDRNEILLYDPQFNYKYNYADNTLGNISLIDVSDPLKITLFKRDYGLIILLDNTLAEIDRLNLYDLGFQGISWVATSRDGHFWIYDNTEYQLKKISQDGREMIRGINLINEGLQNIDPNQIIEKNGYLILKDSEEGVILFDNLGQYIQTFPFKISEEIQFTGEKIVFREGESLVLYSIKRLMEERKPLDPDKATSYLKKVFWKQPDLFYIYREGIIKQRQQN